MLFLTTHYVIKKTKCFDMKKILKTVILIKFQHEYYWITNKKGHVLVNKAFFSLLSTALCEFKNKIFSQLPFSKFFKVSS